MLCLSDTASWDNVKLSMFSTPYRKVTSIFFSLCSFTIPSFSPPRHTGDAKSYTDWDCSHLEAEKIKTNNLLSPKTEESSKNTEVTSSH